MDQVTQQNSAYSEETASASEELSSQAESLKDVVDMLVSIVGSASRKENMRRESSRKVPRAGASKPLRRDRISGRVHDILNERNRMDAASMLSVGVNSGGRTLIKPSQVIPMEEDEFKEF